MLDLASSGFVAVIGAGDQALARRWRPPVPRNDDLQVWMQDCLREAGCGYRDLNWLAVGIGPGSFTGIRVAMAFMQGLAFPRHLELNGFTSFDSLRTGLDAAEDSRAIAVVPANAGRYYASEGLRDPGQVLDTEGLRARGGADRILCVSVDSPAFDPVRSAFASVREIREGWNVPRLLEVARAAGRGATRPYYLMPSAAEARAAGLV